MSTDNQKREFATGFVRPLTTLLFFDKIYVPEIVINSAFGAEMGYQKIPKEYLCPEYKYSGNMHMSDSSFYSGFMLDIEEELKKKYPTDANDVMLELTKIYNGSFMHNSIGRNATISRIIHDLQMRYNFTLTPIYFDRTDLERSLTELASHYDIYDLLRKYGETALIPKYEKNIIKKSAYEIAIKNVPIAIEDKLEPNQLIQIKSDRVSIEKLKKFRCFLNNIPENSTPEEIIELLDQNIEDYKAALKKHGINTAIGTFATVLTYIGKIFELISGSMNGLSIVGAGCSLLGETVTYRGTIRKFSELRKTPIAYYYDIMKKAK